MNAFEQRQAARTATMRRMLADNSRHQQEMRRLKVQEVRAVTDSLGPSTPAGDGFVFTERAEQIEQRRLEHWARQRRAAAARASDDRLYANLRRQFGSDEADAWMSGGDAA